jgi:hypothetical protein
MTAKLKIRAGTVEFELETDTSLTLEEIKSLLHEVEGLSPASASALGGSGGANDNGDGQNSKKSGGDSFKLHIGSIAAKLGAKSGADLAKAAAAQLQLSEEKETFTRQELLLTMKKAPKFYKTTMSKNLSAIIGGLIPETLNQVGEGVYCLTAEAYSALESALA